MHYTITAMAGGERRETTRKMSGSARVVARRWLAEGCVDVRIVGADGAIFTTEQFAARFAGVRGTWKYQNGQVPPLSAIQSQTAQAARNSRLAKKARA